MDISVLPEADAEALKKGIYVNDKEEMFLSFSLADMVLVIQLMDISLLAKISCFYVRSMVKKRYLMVN